MHTDVLRTLNQQGKLDLSVLHGDGSNVVAKKGGECIGYSGHKHQKGQKLMAIVDNKGNVIAPAEVAPVNKSDMSLLPGGLKRFKRICRNAGVVLPKGTVLNLDAGLKPDIKENKRNRKRPKRGRKRFFDPKLFAQRFTIERSFAWEDKFRRVVIRYERILARFFGFQFLAFIMINLRNLST